MKTAELVGLLLVDLILGVQTQPFQGTRPDALLLHGWMSRSGGFRSFMQRQQTRSLPLFMMQLYQTMRIEDHASANIRGHHSRTQDSDCVTSLVAKSCLQVGERWSVTFDLSSMSKRDNIQLAELHIRLPAFSKSSRVFLDICHSNQNRCSSNDCSVNRLLLGHLEAHPTTMVSSSSWKVFNVTGMLHRWLQQESSTNRTVEVGMKKEQQEIIQHPTVNRVMMVVFSSQDPKNQPSLVRTAEQSKSINRRSSRRKRHQETQKHVRFSEQEKQRPLCKKVDMWVDFKKLQWSDWIVQPRRYNAYRCEGSCSMSVDGTLATFNHAQVQSALNYLHPDKVPRLSCAPTYLAPLSMLYYDKRKLVMRHHEDMVVKECGCQ
nr:nodal homolog 2-A [Nothobranchius furzeri]